MTRGTEQGKKIDEIRLDWDTKLVVRYHASRNNPEFTVEAADTSFSGHNLKLLIEQATVHVEGWSKLKWDPIIAIETEIYDMEIRFERLFRSKHRGKAVYRRWRVGEENETGYNGFNSEQKMRGTADSSVGEPGGVDRQPRGRVVPYTPERWDQLRTLRRMVNEAVETAKRKVTDILEKSSDGSLDTFLKQVSSGNVSALPFRGSEAQKI